MTQFDVFLSHNSVDKPWVIELKNNLLRYGVSVWLDQDEIRPGDIFVKALEKGLAESGAMALIISPESMNSEWVEAEYYRAVALSQNKKVALQLIPVILRDAELPGFLTDRSWVDFRDGANYPQSVRDLVWGITGKKPDRMLRVDIPSSQTNQPLSGSKRSLVSPYGTMLPDSPYYIERPADGDGWNTLNEERATTVYIQASRQMGKSSLLRRLAHRARLERGWITAFIDFEKFTKNQLANENEFLMEFCCMIADALNIPDEIDRYWSSRRRSVIVKCSNYLSQYVVPTVGQRFILALDEVERVLGKSFQNDFFGMLRTWHNDRAWDENYAQMTLLLSSSTEPHLFIDSVSQSPFNVARPLSLRDFNKSEVAQLNLRYGSPLETNQLDGLITLLDGHPFLTHLALYLISAGDIKFASLIDTAANEGGPFNDHLRRYWKMIMDDPDLQRALVKIMSNQAHPENRIYFRLKGAGLIKKDDTTGKVLMRNALYARYFEERTNGE